MSKKDYIKIAGLIASFKYVAVKANNNAAISFIDNFENAMCELFKEDNPRFNPDRFHEACIPEPALDDPQAN